ncbi:hypothetical protein S245_057057 [Arachis hypogaea]
MEVESAVKWKGETSTKLEKAKAEQAWALVKDFFNLHKWYPTLPTCYGVHGTNGEPGCIRYCAGSGIPSSDGFGSESVSWSKERLVAVDDADRSIKYEIVESNIGFKSYEATMRVVEESDGGCVIQWCFSVEPVQGWVFQDLLMKYRDGLKLMAAKIDDEIASQVIRQS